LALVLVHPLDLDVKERLWINLRRCVAQIYFGVLLCPLDLEPAVTKLGIVSLCFQLLEVFQLLNPVTDG